MEVKTERTKNPNKRPNPSTMLLVNRFYHVQKHEIIIKTAILRMNSSFQVNGIMTNLNVSHCAERAAIVIIIHSLDIY